MNRCDSSSQVVHDSDDFSFITRTVVVSRLECAVLRVPSIVTGGPGQSLVERTEEIVERPGDDDIIVDAYNARYDHHTVSNTYKISVR